MTAEGPHRSVKVAAALVTAVIITASSARATLLLEGVATKSSLVGVLRYGQTGVVRIMLEDLILRTGTGASIRVRVLNEGAKEFGLRSDDVWTAVMKDGTRVALVERPSESSKDKKPSPRRVVRPLDSLRLWLVSKEGATGEIASLELDSHDVDQTVAAGEEFVLAKTRLVVPPAWIPVVGSGEIQVAIVVGADGASRKRLASR